MTVAAQNGKFAANRGRRIGRATTDAFLHFFELLGGRRACGDAGPRQNDRRRLHRRRPRQADRRRDPRHIRDPFAHQRNRPDGRAGLARLGMAASAADRGAYRPRHGSRGRSASASGCSGTNAICWRWQWGSRALRTASDDHSHAHASDHDHADGDHTHEEGAGWHSHGWGTYHSHRLDLVDDRRPKLGALLALGVVGGLLPDPTALALLLAALASGQGAVWAPDRARLQFWFRDDACGGRR